MEIWEIVLSAFGLVITAFVGTFGLVKLTDSRIARLEGKVDNVAKSLVGTREDVAYIRGRMADATADPQFPSGKGTS